MKKSTRESNNFADALATDMQFAVLTKTGRVQILVGPSAKQLRKRGKRGWRLFGTVTEQADARRSLHEMMKKAISEVENEAGTSNRKQSKTAKK